MPHSKIQVEHGLTTELKRCLRSRMGGGSLLEACRSAQVSQGDLELMGYTETLTNLRSKYSFQIPNNQRSKYILKKSKRVRFADIPEERMSPQGSNIFNDNGKDV